MRWPWFRPQDTEAMAEALVDEIHEEIIQRWMEGYAQGTCDTMNALSKGMVNKDVCQAEAMQKLQANRKAQQNEQSIH